MVRLKLKPNVYSLFILLTMISPALQADNGKELAKLRLRTLLSERPELAEKFLKEIAKKGSGQPTPSKPVPAKPQPKPVR